MILYIQNKKKSGFPPVLSHGPSRHPVHIKIQNTSLFEYGAGARDIK